MDAVLEEIANWQARPLEPVYPLVFFDALCVKIRDHGLVRSKVVYIAFGVRADGAKEILQFVQRHGKRCSQATALSG